MATPAELSIVPRHLMTGLDECEPVVEWAGDPITSSFLVAMSASFPDGERFFIDILRHYESKIADPILAKHVKGFIGQEARHAIAHEKLNQWFEAAGYPMQKGLAIAHWGIEWMKKWLPKWSQLAVTMAIEHFTTRFSDAILTNETLMSSMNPSMRSIWQWHALEESEHKAVAQDVFSYLGGGSLMRRSHFLLGTFLFVTTVILVQLRLLKGTGNLRWSVFKQGWNIMWGKQAGSHGMGKQMMNSLWFDYFRRDFHPFDHGNIEVMQAMHASLEAQGVFQMPPQK